MKADVHASITARAEHYYFFMNIANAIFFRSKHQSTSIIWNKTLSSSPCVRCCCCRHDHQFNGNFAKTVKHLNKQQKETHAHAPINFYVYYFCTCMSMK